MFSKVAQNTCMTEIRSNRELTKHVSYFCQLQ